MQAMPSWHPFHVKGNLTYENHPFFKRTKNDIFDTHWCPFAICSPLKFMQHHFIRIKLVSQTLRNKEKIKVKYTDQNGRPEDMNKMQWLYI